MTRTTLRAGLANGLLLLLAGCSSSNGNNGQTPGPSDVTATWTGSLSSPGTTSVGIQFSLIENSGVLTGQTFFLDHASGAYFPDSDLAGTRNGSDATWQTSNNLVVKGKFDLDGGFAGTLEYPADDPLAIHVVDLALQR